jgi:hypothetical protein
MFDIQKYLSAPTLLNEETLSELSQIIERYPYYQTARILYLLNLHQLDHVSFNTELRNSMIFIQDRNYLFQLFEGQRYELLKYLTVSKNYDASPQPSIVNLTNDYTSYMEGLDDIVLDVDNTTGKSILPQLKNSDLIDAFLAQEERKN